MSVNRWEKKSPQKGLATVAIKINDSLLNFKSIDLKANFNSMKLNQYSTYKVQFLKFILVYKDVLQL